MNYLIKVGPLLSFVLTFIAVPIHDFVSQLVFAIGAVFVYGFTAAAGVFAFPKIKQGRKGLWFAVGTSVIIAVIAFFVGRMLINSTST